MPTVTVIQPTITEEQNTKIRCAAYCRVSATISSTALQRVNPKFCVNAK